MQKRRLIAMTILLLSAASCVAPFGANETIKTDVAAQKEFSTKTQVANIQPCYIMYETETINIVTQEISPTIDEIAYETHQLPETTGFKSYMSYKAITNKKSKQYKLQHEYAYTGNHGIRMYDDRYCIAVGTAYDADVGVYVDLVLENDTVIPCIIADIKADQHTDATNRITKANGCVSEFVVDTKVMHKLAKKLGDISAVDEDWDSPVKEILVYDKNVFDTN